MDDPAALEEAFRIAGENDILVAVHAEDEELIQINREKIRRQNRSCLHSIIRNPTSGGTSRSSSPSSWPKNMGPRLYIAHVSTRGELDLIRASKKRGAACLCRSDSPPSFSQRQKPIEAGHKSIGQSPAARREETKLFGKRSMMRRSTRSAPTMRPILLKRRNAPLWLGAFGISLDRTLSRPPSQCLS